MSPDPVAAKLAEIERIAACLLPLNRKPHLMAEQVAEYVTPLLAAVEAVLKPHQPGRVVIFGSLCKRHEAHRHFSIDAREAADVRACPDCAATVYSSCTGCGLQVDVDACPVRETIRAALAGEEAGDAGTE